MNYSAILPLITSLIVFSLAINSYLNNNKRENFLFFIVQIIIAIINFIFFNMLQSSDVEVINFWKNFIPIWVFVLPVFFHYAIYFCSFQDLKISKITIYCVYFLSIIFFSIEFLNIYNFVIKSRSEMLFYYDEMLMNEMFYAVRIYGTIISISIIFICFHFNKNSDNQSKKSLLKYVVFDGILILICNYLPVFLPTENSNVFFLVIVFFLIPFSYIGYKQNRFNQESKFIDLLFKEFVVKEDEIVIVLNNKKEIIYVNEFFLNSLEYKEKDLLGRYIGKFLSLDVEFHLQEFDVNIFNISFKSNKGNFFKFVVNVVNFKDDNGKYVYTLVIGQDHNNLDKQKFLNICSYCKNVKISGTRWVKFEEYLSDNYNLEFTHGICSDCYKIIIHKYKSEKS